MRMRSYKMRAIASSIRVHSSGRRLVHSALVTALASPRSTMRVL
jgi:hypothetical protein